MEKNKFLMKRTEIPYDEILNDDFDKLWPYNYFTKLIERNRKDRFQDLKARLENIDPGFLMKI